MSSEDDPRGTSPRHAMTLVELLVIIAIIGICVGLLLPATRGAREAARRMSCSNNLKQCGLALHNYHSAHKYLPAAMGGSGYAHGPRYGNANRLSGLVALLPFLEQQALWEQISTPTQLGNFIYPAMGPAPWIKEYDAWTQEIPTLLCPSVAADRGEFGRTNYAFSVGDLARHIHDPELARGMFVCGKTTCFRDIQDGLANTIAMAEIGTMAAGMIKGQVAKEQSATILDNPSLCKQVVDLDRPNFYAQGVPLMEPGRGGRWADGAAAFGLVNTILPPNSPSCAIGAAETVDGLYSAGSFHQGGGHGLMGDGAVTFNTDSIEAGDQTQPTLTAVQMKEETAHSPYGLWGALGTAASKEEIEEQLNQ